MAGKCDGFVAISVFSSVSSGLVALILKSCPKRETSHLQKDTLRKSRGQAGLQSKFKRNRSPVPLIYYAQRKAKSFQLRSSSSYSGAVVVEGAGSRSFSRLAVVASNQDPRYLRNMPTSSITPFIGTAEGIWALHSSPRVDRVLKTSSSLQECLKIQRYSISSFSNHRRIRSKVQTRKSEV